MSEPKQTQKIVLKNVRVHNLKGLDLTLDPSQLIVFTGVSGSGKSSLAFDTIYTEGQRRYVESLSAFSRRRIGDLPKPEADLISGISPTIAIEQKTVGRNPRSTVGTITGVYDYLRVLFARIATPKCPESGEVVQPQSLEEILRQLEKYPTGTKLILLAPYAEKKKAEFKDDFEHLQRKGYTRVRLDGEIIELGEKISIDGKVAHNVDLVIDRLVMAEENRGRLIDSVRQGLEEGEGVLKVLNVETNEESLFSEHAFSQKSGKSYPPLEPQNFSFNHPAGMCEKCQGLGVYRAFNLDKVIDPNLSIAEDCCKIASSYTTVRYGNIYKNLAKIGKFNIHTPWKNLSPVAKDLFLNGIDAKWTRMQFVHPETGKTWTDFVSWKGVLFEAHKKYEEAKSETYKKRAEEMMHEEECPGCRGDRIAPYPAAATLSSGGVEKTIGQLTKLPLSALREFLLDLDLSESQKLIAEEIVKETTARLGFLLDVGLHYLTVCRTAPTLSGGEAQRVRLASQIGSGLVGATYVLDEPSIGLHPRDNIKLLHTLCRLRDLGNTVIVVEHDEETILAADTVVDIGPGAGTEGGELLLVGSAKDLVECKESITGQYLSGKRAIAIPKERRKIGDKKISIIGATHHNLKNLSVSIPLGVMIAVTGVSGSGKSSLITDTLFAALAKELHASEQPIGAHKKLEGLENIDKVISIDQAAIGRTPRSNPATFCKVFDPIRDLFASLPESSARGFKEGRFSFNVKEGSCVHCSGMGMVRIDMDFLEDDWEVCEHCNGRRFDEPTLSILFKGKNIHDVLEMTISQAAEFFAAIPTIKKKLDTLLEVGLGYVKLGQSSSTLSGGEAQRIKLAKELARPSTGRTLYILDEPTTGLHFQDIDKLSQILQSLVNKGNTVLIIEHNMDLVKTVDWIIDIGPEGGSGGGELIAEGTPEAIAKLKTPTGIAVKKALKPIALNWSDKGAARLLPPLQSIVVKKAEQNNLKGINVTIPRDQITICTGPSGSGKSSFAFETIYSEGQRRYTESMSNYSKQFVKQMGKPKVESIDGLSPAIAIEQKQHAGNPRSTVGTQTECYDYLRLIFAHLGVAYCPETGERIESISKEQVARSIEEAPLKSKVQILAPYNLKRGEDLQDWIKRLEGTGYIRIRLDGTVHSIYDKIPYEKGRLHKVEVVIDRISLNKDSHGRLVEAIEAAAKQGNDQLIAEIDEPETGKKDHFFNLAFGVKSTGKSYPPIGPHTFSFNTAHGMCPDCNGLGFQYGATLEGHPEVQSLTVIGLLKRLWKFEATDGALEVLLEIFDELGVNFRSRISSLSPKALHTLFRGSDTEVTLGDRPTRASFKAKWMGIDKALAMAAKTGTSRIRTPLQDNLQQVHCMACGGSRLHPLARNVRIGDESIASLCNKPIDFAMKFVSEIKLADSLRKILEEPLSQLKARLSFLCEMGLHYLSLDRSAPTLSNGEAQRIALARQLGSNLTGCLYVLDEPTIGLHPDNNAKLNASLLKLKNLGNTILMVEHDPLTMQIADQIIDFGPGAGKEGGFITAQGTFDEIRENPNSLTGQFLSGRRKLPIPKKRRPFKDHFMVQNAAINNLKGIDVKIPLGLFTCITGVSGSGKSTLMHSLIKPGIEKAISKRKGGELVEIYNAHIIGGNVFDKIITINQDPIGGTIRANVSTYTDILTPLRSFFASLPDAKIRGLAPMHFSFNHKQGMCKSCYGLGFKNIELQFLPPVKIVCDSCKGFHLNPASLEVKYQGKHLGHILQMTVNEALLFLSHNPKIVSALKTLIRVGLDYVKLDQEIASLSGGEQQRIRLSRELSKRSTGNTLYLIDEPTVGLHQSDIEKLLPIFHSLVEKGNTLVIIEHNSELIAQADWIVDLGPQAGQYGGHIVAEGPPLAIAKTPDSLTGKYLLPLLQP